MNAQLSLECWFSDRHDAQAIRVLMPILTLDSEDRTLFRLCLRTNDASAISRTKVMPFRFHLLGGPSASRID